VLKRSGGGGRLFVRSIRDYLDAYAPNLKRIPPEHLLVFDEAQRAFSAEKVADSHDTWPAGHARSEPEHFIEICDRIPEWSVLVGLIGTGQEIHIGEEGGLAQWRDAIHSSPTRDRWLVHAPANVEAVFAGSGLRTQWELRLNLDTELRFHSASTMHRVVASLIDEPASLEGAGIVAESATEELFAGIGDLRLWLTRDLDRATDYLRTRYAENPDARYGLLASSKDKDLTSFGINNDFQSTKRIRLGPWYTEDDSSPLSCRNLSICITEFQAQGLELDMALVAWGTDLVWTGSAWSNAKARGYRKGAVPLLNPFQLRLNAYRVLLTRGRDGTIVFVPPLSELDATYEHLQRFGFRPLP
jgi:hypothetical protein